MRASRRFGCARATCARSRSRASACCAIRSPRKQWRPAARRRSDGVRQEQKTWRERMRAWGGVAVAAAVAMGGSQAAAQDVKFANIGELSGPGAVSSANWRDGAILAIEEINAKGGILARRIALTNYDDQTNPDRKSTRLNS